MNSTIDYKGDVDYYTYSSSSTAYISFYSSSNQDLRANLYDSDGNYKVKSGNTSSDFVLDYKVKSGTYTLKIENINYETGSYTLKYVNIDNLPYNYSANNTTDDNIVYTFTAECDNPVNTEDDVSYAVSTTKYAESSISTQVKFDAIVSEVGISAKATLGETKTETATVTWRIPPMTDVHLEAGYKYVSTKGDLYKLDGLGNKVLNEFTSSEWSYEFYYHDYVIVNYDN